MADHQCGTGDQEDAEKPKTEPDRSMVGVTTTVHSGFCLGLH